MSKMNKKNKKNKKTKKPVRCDFISPSDGRIGWMELKDDEAHDAQKLKELFATILDHDVDEIVAVPQGKGTLFMINPQPLLDMAKQGVHVYTDKNEKAMQLLNLPLIIGTCFLLPYQL
jgi:hypothetical protein